ncbi:hypothetical protein [Bacteroides sp. AM10-21B]|uniref:hypothetical protein n=1 Tax=Bacteroides sp. AM10-21B TaxID=2292001 RepID=UPI0011C408EA|nr:hypothetical protein [Bacteroides sp. AM10-21B]
MPHPRQRPAKTRPQRRLERRTATVDARQDKREEDTLKGSPSTHLSPPNDAPQRSKPRTSAPPMTHLGGANHASHPRRGVWLETANHQS